MGLTVDAICACGFERPRIPIGGGMANHRTLCAFPAFCATCRSLQVVNLFAAAPPPRSGAGAADGLASDADAAGYVHEIAGIPCPSCGAERLIAYDAPSLRQAAADDSEEPVAEWRVADRLGRDLHLSTAPHRCPACDRFALRFRASGVWD